MAQANPAGDEAGAVQPDQPEQLATPEQPGARQKRATPGAQRSLGRPALLAFVAVSVALIVMIWVDNLTVKEYQAPGYYHGEFLLDEGHYATVTAEAIQFELTLAVTPEPLETPVP